MGPVNKTLVTNVRKIADRVSQDNLFLYSSSISYYSTLALAPFLLIILWLASLIGQDVQHKLVDHAREVFSYEVASMIELVFKNINQRVSVGSITGLIGLFILLWTCSLVFLQFRRAFDVIYRHHDKATHVTVWQIITERLFSMSIVLVAAILLIISFAMAAVVEYIVGPETKGAIGYRVLLFLINYLIYLALFSMIHYLAPTIRPLKRKAVRIALISSAFFILGNVVLGAYLRSVAQTSIYGATGTLLVFLIWAYYSSFTVFLSVELYQYLKRVGKILE